MNKEDIDKKISELRDIRNKYNKLAAECQHDIDNLTLEYYDVSDYINKYYKIVNDDNSLLFLYIKNAKRLFRGPSFYCDYIYIDESTEDEDTIICHFIKNHYYNVLTWDDMQIHLQEITKEEYNTQFTKILERITN